MNKPKCKKCDDKGYYEAFKLDGCTIYRWQKPDKIPCPECDKGRFYAK